MIRRPPRSTQSRSSAASDVYKRQRRVRTVGELLQNQLRMGFVRMERNIRDRMTTVDPAEADPKALINPRPVVAAVREFFGSSQLSQFMDETNPLAALTHKRRLSCLLYTSDAADDLLCVDLGGRRIIKKKKTINVHRRRP